jgi:hypothetical protein
LREASGEVVGVSGGEAGSAVKTSWARLVKFGVDGRRRSDLLFRMARAKNA